MFSYYLNPLLVVGVFKLEARPFLVVRRLYAFRVISVYFEGHWVLL